MGDNNFVIAILVVSALLLMGAIGVSVVEIRGYEGSAGLAAPGAAVETAPEASQAPADEAEPSSAEESSE